MTGIAFDALLAEAEEEFPAYPVTFQDGVVVRLRPSIDLNDAEIAELNKIQEKLEALDENANLTEMRTEYLNALVLVSDNPTAANERFGAAPLKVIVTLFRKYAGELNASAKSEGDAPTSV